jgi:hypothetical protein
MEQTCMVWAEGQLKNGDSTITHWLDVARRIHETAVRAWNRRSLTSYMGWDKHETVMIWL